MIEASWIAGLGVILFGIGLIERLAEKCNRRSDVHRSHVERRQSKLRSRSLTSRVSRRIGIHRGCNRNSGRRSCNRACNSTFLVQYTGNDFPLDEATVEKLR